MLMPLTAQEQFEQDLRSLDGQTGINQKNVIIISIARRAAQLNLDWEVVLTRLAYKTGQSRDKLDRVLKDIKPTPKAKVISINDLIKSRLSGNPNIPEPGLKSEL